MLYKFEDYELDTDRHEFRASGELRAVQPQVFELIRYLLENHGRLVTRDALITAVWDGRIVSESTIDARIHAARKAMDDDGRRQARIKTVPRRGYRLVSAVEIVQSNDLQATASNADARQHFPPPTDRPSIAVLPFQNFSDRPEQDYFSEGIAEDIITALSRFRWFFVIARSSSFTYRGGAHDVRQIAQELGVRYLLEGSVRKTDDRVRVSAQLIDAISGNHIWAETYDRELADMFALQDEMTATIVGAIEPELGDVESVRAKDYGLRSIIHEVVQCETFRSP